MNLVLTPLAIVAVLVGVIAIPFIVGVVLYNIVRLIFGLIARLVALLGGVVLDIVRLAGHLISLVLHVPLVFLSAVFLQFDKVGQHAAALGHEAGAVGCTIASVFVMRPLRFLGLVGPAREAAPKSMPAEPASDFVFEASFGRGDESVAKPGEFEGYKIVGNLPRGGSGARLFIAEPIGTKVGVLARLAGHPVDRVVIKAFSLDDGSTMPQIVRESRALEAARDLGLVFEHTLETSRFFYVMPYVPGDDLATVTRDLHHDSGDAGLNARSLRAALNYFSELLVTIERFHHKGLWHKDIKPSNVIVSKGRVHLVDLGLVTPLRSAMTLTTHGTEYFRDPEMVRLAMRGVKVHEVDGVKFDLYSAGALLYSMLENSFPAHGSLSRFSRRVPEALQWVVRRAMADMHKRYGSAGEMLADLEAVLSSDNPYTLKPSALPSMQGRRMHFKSWEAGGAGASYRVHGFEDRHGAGRRGSLDEQFRRVGDHVQRAGERVRVSMEHASRRFERKVQRKTSRFEARAQARAARRQRKGGGLGSWVAAAVFVFLGLGLFGALFAGSHAGRTLTPITGVLPGYTEYTYEVRNSRGEIVLVSSNQPLSMPVDIDLQDLPPGVRVSSEAALAIPRDAYVATETGLHRVPASSRPGPENPLLAITSEAEFNALQELGQDTNVLVLNDLPKAESAAYKRALEALPARLVGLSNAPSDIDLDAGAKQVVAFAGPSDAAALASLADFVREHPDLDAIFWIGRNGDKPLARLIVARLVAIR